MSNWKTHLRKLRHLAEPRTQSTIFRSAICGYWNSENICWPPKQLLLIMSESSLNLFFSLSTAKCVENFVYCTHTCNLLRLVWKPAELFIWAISIMNPTICHSTTMIQKTAKIQTRGRHVRNDPRHAVVLFYTFNLMWNNHWGITRETGTISGTLI